MKEIDLTNIGLSLRQLRVERNLTGEQVSTNAGMSKSWAYSVERKRDMKIDMLNKYLAAARIEVTWRFEKIK